VEVKQAKNADESNTLKAAKSTERLAIALIVTCFALCGGWFVTPKEIKDKVTPIALFGLGGVGYLFREKIVRIKDGRLALGDLEKSVEHVALLKVGEAARLENIKPFLEGKVPIERLPQVQLAIANQVEAKIAAKDLTSSFDMGRSSSLSDLAAIATEVNNG
jgi:hypothetical protein